jgi:hypothetical protein
MLAPQIAAANWDALAQLRATSRERGVEGMMLKGRCPLRHRPHPQRGHLVEVEGRPYSIDAVLIYAQAGHGRRASLYTDYTFAVWDARRDGQRAGAFAKAYSGLTDAEIAVVDQAIRKTTIEKFGPVRSVTPSMVFEIGFEGIALSSRHKAGIAVRFPRILRQRLDKTVEEADTLASLRALLGLRPASQPTLIRKNCTVPRKTTKSRSTQEIALAQAEAGSPGAAGRSSISSARSGRRPYRAERLAASGTGSGKTYAVWFGALLHAEPRLGQPELPASTSGLRVPRSPDARPGGRHLARPASPAAELLPQWQAGAPATPLPVNVRAR